MQTPAATAQLRHKLPPLAVLAKVKKVAMAPAMLEMSLLLELRTAETTTRMTSPTTLQVRAAWFWGLGRVRCAGAMPDPTVLCTVCVLGYPLRCDVLTPRAVMCCAVADEVDISENIDISLELDGSLASDNGYLA